MADHRIPTKKTILPRFTPNHYGVNAETKLDLNADINNVDLGSDYSNFLGIGEGKVKKALQDAGKNIKETTQKAFNDAGKNISKTTKKVTSNIKQEVKKDVKDIKKNVSDAQKSINDAKKKAADDLAKKAKNFREKEKKFIADGKKELSNLADKIKKLPKNIASNIRNVVRKGIRQGVLLRISKNAHGVGTQLYPAIAAANDPILRAVSPSYTAKAKQAYNDILKEWIKLGGNQSEFNNAITQGSRNAVLNNPYPVTSLRKVAVRTYGLDGDTLTSIPAGQIPVTTEEPELKESALDNVEPTTLQDQNSAPAQEVKLHGIRAFFAKIGAWFKKVFGKHKPNPFEGATTPQGKQVSDQFQKQLDGDVGNEPSTSEASDPLLNELTATGLLDGAGTPLDPTSGMPDAGGAGEFGLDDMTPEQIAAAAKIAAGEDDKDDTILGMPKPVVYIGGTILGVLLVWAVIKLAKGSGGNASSSGASTPSSRGGSHSAGAPSK